MAIDPKRWTHKTAEAVQAAFDIAKARSNPELTPAHLLSALVSQSDGVVVPVLQKVGVNPQDLRSRFDEQIAELPSAFGGGEPQMSRELRDAFERADRMRADLTDEYLSTEHLIRGARTTKNDSDCHLLRVSFIDVDAAPGFHDRCNSLLMLRV